MCVCQCRSCAQSIDSIKVNNSDNRPPARCAPQLCVAVHSGAEVSRRTCVDKHFIDCPPTRSPLHAKQMKSKRLSLSFALLFFVHNCKHNHLQLFLHSFSIPFPVGDFFRRSDCATCYWLRRWRCVNATLRTHIHCAPAIRLSAHSTGAFGCCVAGTHCPSLSHCSLTRVV